MMFHRAAPELNGLGVKTRTLAFKRSFHDVMWSGFPFGTANATTESVTKPCVVGFEFQDDETNFGTTFSMSGSVEKFTTSAGRPAATAFAWVPEAL